MKISLKSFDGRWLGDKSRAYYKALKDISNNNKTEIILGSYKTIELLEFLPQFRYTKNTNITIPLQGYHKVGNVCESDFIKFEVFHKDDHDDPSNTLKLITENGEVEVVVEE